MKFHLALVAKLAEEISASLSAVSISNKLDPPRRTEFIYYTELTLRLLENSFGVQSVSTYMNIP